MKELRKLKSRQGVLLQSALRRTKRNLHELKTDNQNLEKFAREQYRMKKPDEDLYIILTPAEDRQITRRKQLTLHLQLSEITQQQFSRIL
ncbi:MAG: hypothetical protein MZV63_45995 [Marinilabiliales bacterium]|nr:hypothetical protein [Marinilabiliales bacterium]